MTTETTERLAQAVTEVIENVQSLSGRSCPKLDGQLRPIGGLEGFDSLNGLEATRLLEERLGHKLPSTLFLGRNHTEALTVEEIASRIDQLLRGKESK